MSDASSLSSVSVSGSSPLGGHGVEDSHESQNVQQPDRNLLYPGDANSQASTTIPRTPTSMSQSSQGGLSTLRVARVIPTPRSPTHSPAEGSSEHYDSNYSSSDDSESDSAANSDGEGGDLGESDQNFRRAHRDHRSIRLNTLENRQRQAARVIPNRYASIRLRQNQGSAPETDDDPFTFLPPHLEPKIPKKQRQRAKKAIKNLAALTFEETEEEQERCCDRLLSCCHREKKETLLEEEEEDITPSTTLSPEMQKASSQGFSMVKSIIFPSLPAVLQDLWVYLELIISIIAFVFGLLDIFPIEKGDAFNYSYFVLATLAMILALIDGFIYFFQLGSCARGVRFCRQKLKERKQRSDESVRNDEDEDEEEEDDGENEPKKCCGLNKKWISRFNTWFELGRNILTELLLYPLLIFDMFDFITDVGYKPGNDLERTDFSLFVIGGFYLILSVYIMRVFMVAGSMISLIRIPANKASSGDSNDNLILIKFCAHILGQIIVHLMVILVLATKINNENRMDMTCGGNGPVAMNMSMIGSGQEEEDSDVYASPFLITAIVLGGIIPLAGVATFFVVNYYWMKEFSISFWLNMISLLQGESFAEAVFGGEGLTATKEKALDFVEKTQYKKVKKQLKRFKAPSVWTKFFFPARVPLTAISGLLYDIALLAFITCLMLTYQNGVVKLVIFACDDIMTAMFMISVTIIILANIHVLILLNVVLFMVILIFALAFTVTVFLSPLLLFVYFPMVAFLGYFMFCYEAGAVLKKKKTSGRENFNERSLDSKEGNGVVDSMVMENIDSIRENVTVAIDFEEKEESLDEKIHTVM